MSQRKTLIKNLQVLISHNISQLKKDTTRIKKKLGTSFALVLNREQVRKNFGTTKLGEGNKDLSPLGDVQC